MSAMLVTVGGSTEPTLHAIRAERPDAVIFFASTGSRKEVFEAILPELKHAPAHGLVVTEDHERLDVCIAALLRGVPRQMKALGLHEAWPALVAYTAGTKTMAAATVWASSRFPCRFIYVGAQPGGRDKNGLGIVRSGEEKTVETINPWNEMAWYEVQRAFLLFNKAQYAAAADEIADVSQRMDESPLRRMLSGLGGLFQGYHAWDVFDHRRAVWLFGKHHSSFLDAARVHEAIFPGISAFAEEAARQFRRLRETAPPAAGFEPLVLDLLANAKRRAEIEHKYEDAIARCYAAIEKFAKARLQSEHGIDPDGADPDTIPPPHREEYVRRYQDNKGRIRFGLIAAFELLKAVDDPVGLRFREREKEIRSHLDHRNQSILAHGITPMKKEQFSALFEDALFLMNKREDDLIVFPRFVNAAGAVG